MICNPRALLPNPQAQTGISYIPSAGAVTFEDGSRFGIELVDIENSVNISPGSSFTATLTDAVFIGVGGQCPFLRTRIMEYLHL